MKAYVLYEIGDLRYEERPIPVPDKGEALVRVHACGICGSDIPRIYETGAHIHPLIPGHEFSGEVEDVGENTEPSLIGHRVGIFPLIPCGQCPACADGKYEMCSSYDYSGSRRDGAFAEYVCVPADRLATIPDQVSSEQAAMLEPMGVALHAIRRAGLLTDPGNTDGKQTISGNSASDKNLKIAVIGLGPIGSLAVMILKDAGYRDVYAIGNKESQRRRMELLGVDETHYITGRHELGADVVLECVGNSSALAEAVLATAPEARIVLVGNPHGDMRLERDIYWQILRRQLYLTGTWNASYTGAQSDDWSYLIDRLGKGTLHPEKLITHRFPLENLPQGLKIMRDKTEDYCKIMITMPGNRL